MVDVGAEPRIGDELATERELPFVSVLVPVRNEAGFIGGCIEALAAQDYPHERFEVIVIDGESVDATLSEARALSEARSLPVIFRTNPKRTTATGLNLALDVARGDVIVRVDGHTRVDPTFLSASVAALAESDADAVGGPIRTEARTEAGRAIALAMTSRFGVGDAAFRYSDREQWTDTVAFAAYRRDVFDRVGRFAEDIDRGEDDEFNYRLRQHGGRILLTPSIGSVYYARESLGGLLRQYWGYGIAKANVLQRHPGRLRWRHLVPSALVLTLIAGSALSPFDGRFGRIAAIAAGAYAVANAVATLSIARRHGWPAARYLAPAFAAIHFAAGAGMIAGFVRQALSRGKSRDE
jgi:glycosyltransferase involved in cell wall biosynthesis